MLQTGTFWLSLLVLVAMITLKDLLLVTLERAFSTDSRLVLQEVITRHYVLSTCIRKQIHSSHHHAVSSYSQHTIKVN